MSQQETSYEGNYFKVGQVGKSTLCLSLENEYRVFDNLTQREAALHDPIVKRTLKLGR